LVTLTSTGTPNLRCLKGCCLCRYAVTVCCLFWPSSARPP